MFHRSLAGNYSIDVWYGINGLTENFFDAAEYPCPRIKDDGTTNQLLTKIAKPRSLAGLVMLYDGIYMKPYARHHLPDQCPAWEAGAYQSAVL